MEAKTTDPRSNGASATQERALPARAVVLAGGKGTRLGPYTTVLPKPLLPIGNKAILDVLVRQLRDAGITDLTFAVGYLAHLIRAVFGDGSAHGVNIEYHFEEEPLGTVGPLASLDGLDSTFLLMNGDVLTAIDYSDLYRKHREDGNVITIATHPRVVRSDYGVLQLDGHKGGTRRVIGYEEKPEIPYTVSMGIYMAEPHVVDYVPKGERFDLPNLVMALLEAGEPVGSYLYEGYWLDIGRHEDYEQAIADFESLAPMLLGTGEV